jgi:hypothetical protein
MEADFSAHQDRIDGVKIAADQFYHSGHFDAENIKQKQVCKKTFLFSCCPRAKS